MTIAELRARIAAKPKPLLRLRAGKLVPTVAATFAAETSTAPRPTSRTFCGLKVMIENPAGSTRSGMSKSGKRWAVRMKHDYGYISRATGADGEELDVYLGPDEHAPDVYVVHQNDPATRQYDEDKALIGFRSADEAKAAYLANYDQTDFFRSMTVIPLRTFKSMLTSGQAGGVTWKRKHCREHNAGAMFAASAVHAGRYGESNIDADASVEQAAEILARDIKRGKIPASYGSVTLQRLFKLGSAEADRLLADARFVVDNGPLIEMLHETDAPDFLSFAAAAAAHERGELSGGHWVTIGAREDENGKRRGGTPVYLRGDGHVTKGPPALKGRHVGDLAKDPLFDRHSQRRVGDGPLPVPTWDEPRGDANDPSTHPSFDRVHGRAVTQHVNDDPVTVRPGAPDTGGEKIPPPPAAFAPIRTSKQLDLQGNEVGELTGSQREMFTPPADHLSAEGAGAPIKASRSAVDPKNTAEMFPEKPAPPATPLEHLQETIAETRPNLEQLKQKLDAPAARGSKKSEPAALPREELRRRILEHHEQTGGAVPMDVHVFAESLQNAFTFHRNSKYRGELRNIMGGKEGGSEGVAIARSGAIRLTDRASESGGEDAINAFRERYGARGEDLYWRVARERAGLGWKDAIESARKSDDPQIRFLAALHHATPTRKAERAPQDRVSPAELPMDSEFKIHGEDVRVTEDEDGQRVLQDGTTLPETPLDALDEVPVDKGTLRARKLPAAGGAGDDVPFAAAPVAPRVTIDQLKSHSRKAVARRANTRKDTR